MYETNERGNNIYEEIERHYENINYTVARYQGPAMDHGNSIFLQMYFNELLTEVEGEHDYDTLEVACGCYAGRGLECDVIYAKDIVENTEDVADKDVVDISDDCGVCFALADYPQTAEEYQEMHENGDSSQFEVVVDRDDDDDD